MPGAETFRASADAYDRLVGRYAPSLASALIEFTGVEQGMRALDVGCGPGALTAALADRLGPGSVCGAEPSEPFAEACRARLPGVEVVSAAAEALPFGDGSFDVTLSQLVVNFMRDSQKGVLEMARVTRPGRRGRLVRLGLRGGDDAPAGVLGRGRRGRARPRRRRRGGHHALVRRG